MTTRSTRWTARGGAKIWEFKTGWHVYSSPAIGSDGTVYVGSYDKKVYALNGKTGVDPVPLEDPRQVPPPEELSSLHFGDKWISFKNTIRQ